MTEIDREKNDAEIDALAEEMSKTLDADIDALFMEIASMNEHDIEKTSKKGG